MKKFIYTAIALAAVAVGCTKSNIVDVPAEQKTPIAFDTYNGRVPVTRAEEITKDNIESIQVTGFHVPTGGSADYTKTYMNPPAVTREKSGEAWGSWGYSPLSYWPASGTLEFVAYGSNTPRVEAAAAGKLVAVNGSYANFTYTVPTTVAAQEDLIAAGKDSYQGTTTVTFKMKHLLSRVGFKLQTVGSGTSVTISEVSLNGKFVNNGTVNLATGTAITPKAGADLTAADYTTSYSLFAAGESFGITKEESAANGTPIFARYTSDGEGGSTTNTDNSDRYMMIMPGTVADNDQAVDEIGTTPYIQVTYKLGDGTPQTKKLPLVDESGENWEFAAGTAYEFIFKVSISAIEFTGEVVDWDEDINGDTIVNEDDYID